MKYAMKKCIILFLIFFSFVCCKDDDKQNNFFSIENNAESAINFAEGIKKQLRSFSFNKEELRKQIKQSKNSEIRKLANLTTDYSINKNDISKMSNLLNSFFVASSDNNNQNESSKKEEFIVSDWGPKSIAPSAMETPFFYVSFNLPIKSLEALSDDFDGSNFFTITPNLKGKYKFVGTRQINFYPEEELDPFVSYKIEVNKELKNIDRINISGQRIYATVVEKFEIGGINPGSTAEDVFYYEEDVGVPIEKASNLLVFVNAKCSEESFKKNIEILCDNKKLDYINVPLKQSYDEDEYDYIYTKNELGKIHSIKINSKLEKNKSIIVQVVEHNDKQRIVKQEFSYKTTAPLKNTYITYQDYLNGIQLNFNQPIKKESVFQNIEFNPKVDFTNENIEVFTNSVYIKNLTLKSRSTFEVKVKKDLQDIYGQKLGKDILKKIELKPKDGYFSFYPEEGKILEAKYASKYLLRHRNIFDANYFVTSTQSPFDGEIQEEYAKYKKNQSQLKEINSFDDDIFHYEEIVLDKYLKQGLGFVRIFANYGYKTYYYGGTEETRFNIDSKTIQVTDLGVTTRVGYNKLIAIVRRLSDNSPVPNAKVYFFDKNKIEKAPTFDKIKENCFSSVGVTDKNGYCEIIFNKEDILQMQEMNNYKAGLYVSTDNDNVIFQVQTHYTWQEGISSLNIKNAFPDGDKSYAYIFTDRGIYKPGETVTFKGIVRKKVLDNFEVQTGKFEIDLRDDMNKTIDSLQGSLSNAGSFFGSFVIPNNANPGQFSLCLKMNSKKITSESFKVSYFEKVKYQIATTIEEKNYFVNDKIKADVTATYLAGGALNDAAYKVTWYKTPVQFLPKTKDADNYIFGPINYDNSSRYISEQKGKLDLNGKTQPTVTTVSDEASTTFNYKVEVSVKDIANQTIFSSASKIVHPGLFYIGIEKSKSGFYSLGDSVVIPFALFDVEGKIIDENLIKEKYIKDKVKVEITRETWSYVNKDAVGGVYSSWEKAIENIKSFEVVPKQKSQCSFKVEKSGYYTISFSAKDKNNNLVKSQKQFFVTGSNYVWRNQYNQTSLKLSPDKSKYKIGQTAKILLESPLEKGDYLVTVERESILDSKIIHAESGCTQIEIPIKKEYLPVVYVSVCSYSARTVEPTEKLDSIDEGKPKGYYGVTKICTDLQTVSFDVDIKTNKKSYKPGEKITIDLTATKDNSVLQNAELSVVVVDRAVTDLIDYHVTNPLETFYNEKNFGLCVTGGDSRSYLIDPIVYKIKNLQGGDKGDDEVAKESMMLAKGTSNFMDLDGKVRNDFRPTAFFEPNVITDKNGKAKVSFTLPDSLTTYRITVVGISKNDFALSESEFVAQNPINVQPVQPRRMRVRDTAQVGILLTNNESVEKHVEVDFSIQLPQKNYFDDIAQGLITKKGQAFIEGKNKASIEVPPKQTIPLYFDIGAKKEGNVELAYSIKSDVLNEKLVSRMIIEKSNSYETVATTNIIDESSTKFTEQIIIPNWAQDDDGYIQLTLDPSQIGIMSEAVNYVFDYPYGCLEQQSAKILPLILFEKYIDALGVKSKVENPRKLILSWFEKIKKEQKTNGAFPYWSGGSESRFVSLRFAHIYYIAKQNGFTEEQIGYDVKKLLTYLNKSKESLSQLELCYACYIFSLFNNDSLNSKLESLYSEIMNSKKSNSLKLKEKYLSQLCYIALAYQNSNNAKELLSMIRDNILPVGRGVSLEAFKTSKMYFGDMFDSQTESLALVLQLLVKDNPNDELVNKVLFSLLQTQRQGFWQSTSTTAKVFESISVLIKSKKLEELNFISAVKIKSAKKEKELMNEKFVGLKSKAITNEFLFTNPQLKDMPRNDLLNVEVSKNGTGSLYYTMLLRYAIPAESIDCRDEGFETTLLITDEEGNVVKPESNNSKVIILENGKTYKFSATVSSQVDRKFVAIKIPVPSGTEIADSTLSTGGVLNDDELYFQKRKYSHEYLYDNEAQFFKNNFPKGMVESEITVRATRNGVYPTPPVFVECMYEPEVFGRTDGYLFIVK